MGERLAQFVEAASFQVVFIGVVRVKCGTANIGGGANIVDADPILTFFKDQRIQRIMQRLSRSG